MCVASILTDREAVAKAVAEASSIAGALRLLGLRPAGGNYRALHQACARFGLEVPAARKKLPSPGPDSDRRPDAYRAPALPAELPGRNLRGPLTAVVLAALAAGCLLALAVRDGSRFELAGAVAIGLLVLAAAAT